MAQGFGAIRRETVDAGEKTSFGSKMVCVLFGHDEEWWHYTVIEKFSEPIILGGQVISEIGEVPEERRLCRRCGKFWR